MDSLINRPAVAGAVLQTAFLFIHSFSQWLSESSFSSKSLECFYSKTVGARKLKFLENVCLPPQLMVFVLLCSFPALSPGALCLIVGQAGLPHPQHAGHSNSLLVASPRMAKLMGYFTGKRNFCIKLTSILFLGFSWLMEKERYWIRLEYGYIFSNFWRNPLHFVGLAP